MNGNLAEAEILVKDCIPRLAGIDITDMVICPPYTALALVQSLLGSTIISMGAQDMFWKDKGAYTGEISAPMLKELGCRYVIVGHSERRARFGVPEPDFTPEILLHFGDNNAIVNKKAHAAVNAGLIPIICVGEILTERHAGDTDRIVEDQTRKALAGFSSSQASQIVMAYEPVWAIGTGEVCAADEADRVCGVIRKAIADCLGEEASQIIRIQYGGSVKPDNAADLLSRPNIDGALVGGASLKAADFAAIIAAS